jgi:hypothetical protein
MIQSKSIGDIAPALLKAQKEMTAALKGSKNPFFKSKYADLNAILEACKGPLNDNGIIILQPHRIDLVPNPTGVHEVLVVETILLHETGDHLISETKMELPKSNDPQALGSCISYCRRYGLQSFISLPAVDDDAEGAMNRKTADKTKTFKTEKKSDKPAPKKDDKKKSFRNKDKAPVVEENNDEELFG